MTTTTFTPHPAATAVCVEAGSDENRDGDEIQIFYVFETDDDGEPVETKRAPYFYNRDAALDYADSIAHGREVYEA